VDSTQVGQAGKRPPQLQVEPASSFATCRGSPTGSHHCFLAFVEVVDAVSINMSDIDQKACRDAAQQLALCVERSPCVTEGGTISECLRAGEAGGAECAALRRAYFECRRSQLDMRTRIRGRKMLDASP
jgi:cytochrome c oxidase assembly factor 5